jgi:class 3 adenylate cyclase
MACGASVSDAPEPGLPGLGSATTDRKPMTIVFADIVGSTALAETMDPEDWRRAISLLFGQIAPVIDRYEGTLARILGDALLIYFGAPIAHEDDAVRAIRAALELLDVVQDTGAELEARHGFRLPMRVGVHTGLVVVGDLAGAVTPENLALGDAMNLAARIEATAEPMTAYVSDDTHRLAAPFFDWQDMGSFELKGKREPVHLWRALTARAGPASARGFADITAPMVGRQEESDRLLETTAALADVGAGAVVAIVGEPGIGKTRLTAEWSARAPGELTWVRASCLSYGRRLAYHTIVDLLRSTLVACETTPVVDVRQQLVDATQRFLGGSAEASAVLADLLSLEPLPEEQPIIDALDSQARQSRYVRTVADLLTGLAARRPVVALIEDVHWADPTSVLVLRHLLPLATTAPILFCLTSRPGADAPVWSLLSEPGAPHVAIELEPLGDEQTRALVRALLAAAAMPADDDADLLAHAEGNPLFAEELVRAIIDRHSGTKAGGGSVGGIPDTIHGLLLARIDSLPPSARRTARLAAVAGRRFPVRVLEEAAGA